MLADVGVHVVGLYGLESAAPDGVVVEHEKAGSWRRVVDEVVDRARTDGPAGMGVEHKGLSLTLHYRSDPGLERDVVAWARDEGERTQLSVRAAKQSVELHPPVDIDKGTALLEHLRRDDGPVVYVGDDLGDLPAFDALDRLASEGRRVLRVAVAGDEAPHELLDRGDVVVAGTGEVPEFLLS